MDTIKINVKSDKFGINDTVSVVSTSTDDAKNYALRQVVKGLVDDVFNDPADNRDIYNTTLKDIILSLKVTVAN